MNIARVCGTAALVALSTACSRTPSEPERQPTPPAQVVTTPSLKWDAPATWTSAEADKSGPRKASWKVPKTGNDKEEAVVEIFYFGSGTRGDAKPMLDEWLGLFDGDAAEKATWGKLEVHGFPVETVEASGRYKVPVGPPIGPKKKTPMQIVKESWRIVAAVVETPDRGNWFFKLSGPDDTVQSAKSAFRTLVESAR